MKKSLLISVSTRLQHFFSLLLLTAITSPNIQAAFDPVNDDTDIFLANPNIVANRPNVLLILDNTANWARNVNGQAIAINELSAISEVVANLGDEFNVGLMLYPETGTGNNAIDGGFLRFGIRQLTTTNRAALSSLVGGLDNINDRGNNNTVSAAMMEAYRYFAGKANIASHGKAKTDFDGNTTTQVLTPFELGLGDHPLAANPTTGTLYDSPIDDICQDSFIIYISNGLSNENAAQLAVSEAELDSLGYDISQVISLSPSGQQGNWMDEWAYYMANADINGGAAGEPHVLTYVIEVDPQTTGLNPDMTSLLKSTALKGKGSYFSVSSANAGQAITNSLNSIFTEIQAVNSVFASTTLPVSVNVRGTNLNQVYIGVFRPDASKSPRWFGNLKLYELGFDTSTQNLFLADANGAPAENSTTGFIDPSAASFHTSSSAFWNYRVAEENGAGGSSDLPDGDLVEKGGIGQNLRVTYATDQTGRKLYTCTSGSTVCSVGSSLSATPFAISNDGITNAGLGLGISPITSLTGYATQTITQLTDIKTLTSLSTAATPQAVASLTSVLIDPVTITSMTTNSSKTLASLDNNAVVQSMANLSRGTGSTKNIATATVNGHGYSTGQVVHIAGVASAEYNGSFTISVLDINRFSYDTGNSNPTVNPVVTGATATTTSSLVTATTTIAHGFSSGDSVIIAGVTPTDFNSTQTINVIDTTTFTYSTASALAPVTSTAGATATGPSTTATVIATGHGYITNDLITITGASPNEYNGTFTITMVDLNTFTYTVPNALVDATGTMTASKGSLATATVTGHGFATADIILIGSAIPSGYNGSYSITRLDDDTFTYTTTEALSTSPATGAITVSSGVSLTATASLSGHGLVTGDNVTISGATPADYDGDFTITKIDNDSFIYTVATTPIAATILPTVQLNNAAVTAIATLPSNGYSTGNSIDITGATPSGYNGTFTITKTSDDTFQYTMPMLVTTQGDATGTIEAKLKTTIAKARVVNHGFADGDSVAIAGAVPTVFNATFTITLVDVDNFTYTLPSAQGDAAGTMIASSGSGSAGDRADLINWVRGTDNDEDENADGSITDARSSIHGDVLHSRPAVINYNRHGNDDDVYVFYGANDGVFRAIKGGASQSDVSEPEPFEEAWGFIPEEFFSKLSRLRNNEPMISSSNKKPYFADGTVSTYVLDSNNDGSLVATDGDKVYIYITMHRGDRAIYALDVSDPQVPKLLWNKSNADPGWEELGQTWSAPNVAEVAIDKGAGDDDDDEVVLIFGAGYDPNVEDVDPQIITSMNSDVDTDGNTEVVAGAANFERSMGRGIFVVDAITGDILWQAGPSVSDPGISAHYESVTGMDFAIASDLVVISDRGSSDDNRIYVGDTGGQMWRVDMNDPDVTNWDVTKIASVADHTTTANATDVDDNPITIIPGIRKFLFPPDVVYSDDGYDAILIGSGDREHPFDDGVVNRFYMFKDSNTGTTVDGGFTTLTEPVLFDATTNCIQVATACASDPGVNDVDGDGDVDQDDATSILTGAKGWYITLTTGEKVVGNAITLNNVTFFNTNVPSNVLGTSSCSSNLGEARQYKVNFDNATAIADQNIDGYTDTDDRYLVHTGGGYLPSPVPVVVEINGEIHEGVISGVAVGQPPGTPLNTRLRRFWYKEID